MKRTIIAVCAEAFLFACNSAEQKTEDANVASSESDSKAKTEWIPVDSATAMKKMMEAGTLGPQHAMLAKSDGNWNAETTMWWTPDGPPQTSKATCTNKMIFGGRYQQSTFKGDFGGMPFEGTSTTGYDNTKKVFFTSWIDNMGTGIMYMEGTWDPATKTANFKGKSTDAVNKKEMDVREVFTIIDDNMQKMEMYMTTQGGQEMKTMEITLKRKK